MAIIHANQPGAVHNIEPGSIGDRDISSGDPIDAVTKIKNLDKAASGLVGPAGPAGKDATLGTNAFVLGTAAAAGTATTAPRTDDTIAAFDATAPTTSALADAAAAGTVARAARRDHRHGRESFATNAIVLGTAAAAGVATTPNRSDDTIAAFDATVPTTSAVGDAAATGSVARAARRDHTHGREAFATNAVLLSTAAAAGAATTPMRSNDTIAAFDATVPTTAASNDTAATGTVAFAARRDHRHGMPVLLVGTPTVTTFTANGTWTRATGTAFVYVRCVGGGGGGGGSSTTSTHAGGGGGGAYSESWLTATAAGASQTVTVGGGGAGGTTAPTAGSAGGTSSFGTLLSSGGGSGGARDASGGSASNGGAGGTATAGQIQLPGQKGNIAFSDNVNFRGLGHGGAAGGGMGAGGGAGITGILASEAGKNYGGGGGGGVEVNAGKAGAGGIVIVIEIS